MSLGSTSHIVWKKSSSSWPFKRPLSAPDGLTEPLWIAAPYLASRAITRRIGLLVIRAAGCQQDLDLLLAQHLRTLLECGSIAAA